MLVCTCSGGRGSGGKSRRNLAGTCLKSEPRSYVSFQALLIAFDREQVVASLLDDLGAQIALAEHRIAHNHTTPKRQNAQQFQGGFMFVGLGINADLSENRSVLMSVGGDQVVTRRLTVATTTQCLAVKGDRLRRTALCRRWQARGNPAGEGCLKSVGVHRPEKLGETRRGGSLLPPKTQGMSQFNAVVATELRDSGGPLATA
jgi:hypothetical protein